MASTTYTSSGVSAAGYSNAIKTEYERRLLIRALPRLVHGRWAMPARLSGYGSYELRRYESLSANTTPLAQEGVTPDEEGAPDLTLITITPVYYGTETIQ